MQTIERNYTKNPHTARFLRTFHDANGANNVTDLLDSVPVEAPAYRPSNAQESYIHNLTIAITALDAETGAQAAKYTADMNAHNAWTFEKTSDWIDRLKAKRAALRAVAPVAPQPTMPVQPVTDLSPGRYGIEKDGGVKCYSVSYGKAGTKWDGFLFLNRISSDDEFPIKNPAEKALILTAIKADAGAARILAALTLRKCLRCGRQLSDTKNPYFGQGLGPDCGAM